jgi:hypothetical protein
MYMIFNLPIDMKNRASGTVMGTTMAVSCTNIFIGRLVHERLYHSPVNLLVGCVLYIHGIKMKWINFPENLNTFHWGGKLFPQPHQVYCGISTSRNIFSGYHSHAHLEMGEFPFYKTHWLLFISCHPFVIHFILSKVCRKVSSPASASHLLNSYNFRRTMKYLISST